MNASLAMGQMSEQLTHGILTMLFGMMIAFVFGLMLYVSIVSCIPGDTMLVRGWVAEAKGRISIRLHPPVARDLYERIDDPLAPSCSNWRCPMCDARRKEYS